jgi:hypothetical protein
MSGVGGVVTEERRERIEWDRPAVHMDERLTGGGFWCLHPWYFVVRLNRT